MRDAMELLASIVELNDSDGPRIPQWHLAWGDLMREAREAVKASKTPEKSNTSGAEAAAKLAAERAEMRALLRACQRHLACNAATEDLKALYQSICNILDR
jgi:hypothetical protein